MATRILLSSSVLSLLVICAGCGGGGGGGYGNPTPTPTPQAQSISFAQSGTVQTLKGLGVTNVASGGAGTGAITYASSDTSIATVNATSGAVVAVASGNATITATKAADANYLQATVSYTISVQTQATMSAWIGSSAAQVTFPASVNGAQFIRSNDRNCDLNNASTCANGQMNGVATGPITDTAATTTSTGYYALKIGNTTTNILPVSTRRFSERLGHTAVLYNGRYWITGGMLQSTSQAKNDVWSSADGKTWELETANAGYTPRAFHQSVVYNGKMWVIGGVNALGNPSNDIWSSDGKTVTQVASSTLFNSVTNEDLNVVVFNGAMWAVYLGTVYSSTDGAVWTIKSSATAIDNGAHRGGASLTVYANKLWYVAGARNYNGACPSPCVNTGDGMNDVWSSADGITWTRVTANAAFSPRWRHSAFVMNNKLWIMGGTSIASGVGGPVIQDTWSTTDGATWTRETLASSVEHSFLAAIVQDSPNKVTMIGEIMRPITNEVWQTTDGIHWSNLSNLSAFTPRAGPAIEFLGDFWMIGGATAENGVDNQIWRSSDGLNWTQVSPSGTIFSPRDGHQLIVFNNKLWLIGGWDETVSAGGTATRQNDVWSTADGISWTKQTPATSIFSPRIGHQAVVFNNKLWIIGGDTATGLANDIWSTTDGVSWTLEAASANFSARASHSATAFNGALWIIGGQNGSTPLSDIWQSTDGVHWNAVTPIGSFAAARSGHATAIYNNRMWLAAGWAGISFNVLNDYYQATRFNDVWSTADGVNWRRETAAAAFEQRIAPLINHNNELWLIGGIDIGEFNDVWRSTDGVTWRVGMTGTFTVP